MKRFIEIVNTSECWTRHEDKHGICSACSGDGDFATTNRACSFPEKHPDELVTCGTCRGSGHRAGLLNALKFRWWKVRSWLACYYERMAGR